MRTIMSRTIATAAAAAIALTTFSLQPGAALASEASGQRGDFEMRAPDTRTEPGSSARDAGSRHGDAAALGAFAAVFGTIAAIIAAEQYRDQPSYGPPYGPAYGYGPTYGYGPVYPGGVPHGPWRHHHHW